MKKLTRKTKGIMTIVASIGLSLYSIYEIVRVLSITLDSNRFIFKPFIQRVLFFLDTSIYNWGLLALGLCGWVFVYADLNDDKDMDVQNRIAKIKKNSGKILFGAYLISKNDKILKPFLMIFFVGCSYTLIMNVYELINGSIQYANSSKIFINTGLAQSDRLSMILLHMTDILNMIASVIIILYGVKKENFLYQSKSFTLSNCEKIKSWQGGY